jgi:uncharacterized protein YndB with AHSA1/START domain
MNEENRTAVHATFTIERTFPAAPKRVFEAFADEKTKRRWLVSGHGEQAEEYKLEFKVGGRERSRFRFSGIPGGPVANTMIANDTTYLDIVPDTRIVFAYTMTIGDHRMSASLATVLLAPVDGGTRLTFTEQAAFFERSDGPELRKQGWTKLFEQLAEALKAG